MTLAEFSWRDPLDIALVAIVIYNLLLLIRGTRGVQILLGILFLGGIYWAAGYIGLPTLQALLGNFIFILPSVVLILFPTEIRRALPPFWPSRGCRRTFSRRGRAALGGGARAGQRLAQRSVPLQRAA